MNQLGKNQKFDINSIRVEDLHFAFESGGQIFQGATFDFPLNQIVWVQGENGSGRSTLLQVLAGLLLPQQGNYLINGESVTDMSFEEFLPYRLNIGYGFDMGGLLHNRTLLENLTLPLLYHELLNTDEAEKRALRYMDQMGIAKYKDQRPSSVPGGVRKIICLIRSLIHHPQVLLLDDPSVGLTQELALKFFDIIADLRQTAEIRHIFLSSFDNKLMSILNPSSIAIDSGLIHHFDPFGEKKVVHL